MRSNWAQFGVCIFLESRYKSLNMLKFCQNDKKITKKQKKIKASVFDAESAYN